MDSVRALAWLCTVSLAACSCGDPVEVGDCELSSDCEASFVCVDRRCIPRTVEDTGTDTGRMDSGVDTGPVCPRELRCGAECCEADAEECIDSMCLPVCESGLRCGDALTCCGTGEFCIDDACVEPGDECSDIIDCPAESLCDPGLGRCLPRGSERCEYFPPSGVFEPAEEWHWSGSEVEPAYIHTMMTPVVGDVTGDGIPEVLFMTYGPTSYPGRGVLRIVQGDTAEEVGNIVDPVLCGSSGIAIGDLDADGVPEILVGGPCNPGQIHAFHADGTLVWRSTNADGTPFTFPLYFGGISIADLEGDGMAEVIVGGTVLESNGVVRFTNRHTAFGCCGASPISQVTSAYDVVEDDNLEIVGANIVYRADGTVVWDEPTLPEGYIAVADFFSDAIADIVIVHAGSVSIRSAADGSLVWGPIALPGTGRGGPPTVADFDGDGEPEIGVAGATAYSVFNPDAAEGEPDVLWSRTTQDGSSNVTGSSVFDFDGDGRAEVVYNDECYMRIYAGTDGEVLREVAQNSHTLIEYPVIADIDADGNAEIVFAANAAVARCGGIPGYEGNLAGARAFGDALDNWVGTRPVWNQHAYSITNIRADLSVPARQAVNHERFNNFRQNSQTFDAPNLQAELGMSGTGCAPDETLRATVFNRGAVTVGAGLAVSFYGGSPAAPGRLFGTVRTTRAIPPGASEDVELSFAVEDGEMGVDVPYFARVDDIGDATGEHNECIEEDNEAEGTFRCSSID